MLLLIYYISHSVITWLHPATKYILYQRWRKCTDRTALVLCPQLCENYVKRENQLRSGRAGILLFPSIIDDTHMLCTHTHTHTNW